jgi:hypothetical protein
MKLTTIRRVKLFLDDKTGSSGLFDDLLTMIVEWESAKIERALKRWLTYDSYTEYRDAGKRLYYMKAYPIVEDEASEPLIVTVDDMVKVKGTDYYLWKEQGLIEFEYAPTYTKPRQVKFVWTGGYRTITEDGDRYGALDIPLPLEQAAIMQCAFVFRRRNDIGLSAITLPDGSVSTPYSGDLLPQVRKIIAQYMRSPDLG